MGFQRVRTHWGKMILIPALLATLAGFLLSYLFSAKYTSQSLVLVEAPKVPEGIVRPVVTEDLAGRIATLQQQVLSQSRLQPMLERLGLAKSGQNMDDAIDGVRANMTVEPLVTDLSQIAAAARKSLARAARLPVSTSTTRGQARARHNRFATN